MSAASAADISAPSADTVRAGGLGAKLRATAAISAVPYTFSSHNKKHRLHYIDNNNARCYNRLAVELLANEHLKEVKICKALWEEK